MKYPKFIINFRNKYKHNITKEQKNQILFIIILISFVSLFFLSDRFLLIVSILTPYAVIYLSKNFDKVIKSKEETKEVQILFNSLINQISSLIRFYDMEYDDFHIEMFHSYINQMNNQLQKYFGFYHIKREDQFEGTVSKSFYF